MNQEYHFRNAEEKDVPLVLSFIRGIAEYEKMSSQVIATNESLHEWMFERKLAEVIFVLEGNKEVGFALFFQNFSTFIGRAGMYLEDFYVLPEYRKKGYGKALFKKVAEIAVERKCQRMEWVCLNWNKPSIEFYQHMEAIPLSDWTTYRLSGETIRKVAFEK